MNEAWFWFVRPLAEMIGVLFMMALIVFSLVSFVYVITFYKRVKKMIGNIFDGMFK